MFTCLFFFLFFFNAPATTEIYTLSLHDALPIRRVYDPGPFADELAGNRAAGFNSYLPVRSEEHTSELQSHVNLVCRLLLEKKKKKDSYQVMSQSTKNKLARILTKTMIIPIRRHP